MPKTSPVVTITAPGDGAWVTEGDVVTFVGVANDAEDGALTAYLEWRSNIAGVIGTGATFSRSDLGVGEHLDHRIRNRQQRPDRSDQITVTVAAEGTAWTCGWPVV